MNIGTSLILQATGAELQHWPDVPNSIVYKGETRTGAIVGAQIGGDALLVDRVLDVPPPPGNPPVTSETVAYNGSVVVVSRQYGAPNLAPLKTAAKTVIGRKAEEARSRYITPGSGKALSYQEVAEEAKRHLATGGAGDYPFLQARVASGRYPNLVAARDGTLALEAQWAIVGAQIDEVEDRAKLAVDNATTVEQIYAAEQTEFN